MNISRITILLATVFLFCSGQLAVAQDNNHSDQDASPRQLTAAEKDILMPGHMRNINKPVKIVYEFNKSGSYEKGFEDTVVMKVKEFHDDDTVTIDLNFFSGPREVTFIQPHNKEHINVNSVLLIYLQGDVYEMTRLTERNPQLNVYFNKRIRWALADGYESEKVQVEFQGERVQATKYTITPYADDPNRADYDKFADKRYEFIISEAIPGKLYQIHTIVPNNLEKNAPPLIEETLTIASVKPLE